MIFIQRLLAMRQKLGYFCKDSLHITMKLQRKPEFKTMTNRCFIFYVFATYSVIHYYDKQFLKYNTAPRAQPGGEGAKGTEAPPLSPVKVEKKDNQF